MIVLDTNVLSELQRARPEPRVLQWLRAKRSLELFTTAICEAEMRFGVLRLPDGSRRHALQRAIDAVFKEDFKLRVLPFGSEAAQAYAHIASARAQSGRPISIADGQIAAICQQHGATLASRNIRDFVDCHLNLVNPWD